MNKLLVSLTLFSFVDLWMNLDQRGLDSTWDFFLTTMIFDVLSVFNFTTGQEDVARVTKEAFLICNSTNPISLITAGPANYSLNSTGEYYFIGTLNNNCALGQRLAINVTTSPGPTASPVPRTIPENYTVGDKMGWIVPPLGEIAYITWAYNKTFIVGDTLGTDFKQKYFGEKKIYIYIY